LNSYCVFEQISDGETKLDQDLCGSKFSNFVSLQLYIFRGKRLDYIARASENGSTEKTTHMLNKKKYVKKTAKIKRTRQARSNIKSHAKNTKINKPDKEKRGKRTNARARDGNLRRERKEEEEEMGKRNVTERVIIISPNSLFAAY
jgi:hypothetical protein